MDSKTTTNRAMGRDVGVCTSRLCNSRGGRTETNAFAWIRSSVVGLAIPCDDATFGFATFPVNEVLPVADSTVEFAAFDH